jgi:thymidylate synthase
VSVNGEIQYLDILRTILEKGTLVPNRTGISAHTVPHMMIQHDMSLGFPLLTTKKMAWKTIKVELEGFIKGITDKKWFQERGCHIWDEWCNPKLIPAGLSDEERKKFQLNESRLGAVYGSQWRNFNGQGYDQLNSIIETLKKSPLDRRMLCSGWNPLALDEQALPPCHVLFHLTVIGNILNLCWFQRSVDVQLGLPFNLASYGILLHLLAKEAGLREGTLTGFLSNCHIYENHVEGTKIQLSRIPLPLPQIETTKFTSTLGWEAQDTILKNYFSHDKISFEIAI